MSIDLQSEMQMSQSPILDTTGVEIFSYFAKKNDEGKTNLDQDALDCLAQLKERRFLVVVAFGPNGSGKGGLLKGFRRIIQQDETLNSSFAAGQVELDIQSYPFALMDDCVQLPGTPAELLIPPDYNPATYTFDHTRRASNYQWQLIQQRALSRLNNPRLATAVLVEASTPLAYPISDQVPVEMVGIQDLGLSTISNLAYDERTRDFLRIYAVDRNDFRVAESALATRTALHTDQFDADRSFLELLDKMVIPIEGNKEIEVSKLPTDVQAKVRTFILKTQAPPGAIKRLDQDLAEFKSILHQEGLISGQSNSALFEFFGRRLGLWQTSQFTVLENGFRAGRKTDDLGYFTESEPVRVHPQILAPLDLDEVCREGKILL